MYGNHTVSDARHPTLSRVLRGLRALARANSRPAVSWMIAAALLLGGLLGCGGRPDPSASSANTTRTDTTRTDTTRLNTGRTDTTRLDTTPTDTASPGRAPRTVTSGAGPAGSIDSLGVALPVSVAGWRTVEGDTVRTVLRLEPDGTYRLVHRTGDSTRAGIGRWYRGASSTRLTLTDGEKTMSLAWTSPDTIRAGRSGVGDDAPRMAYPLVRTSSPVAAPAPFRINGQYVYYADAGRFRPCRTGIDLRVAQEESNAALERAYLEARPGPQARAMAVVDGRVEQRPRIDSPGREEVLIVERVVRIDPNASCDPEDVPLAGTSWRLVQLDDHLLSPDVPEAKLRLTESDSTVAGTGGCNRLGGRYRLDGPTGLSFSGIAATKRLCEEATMRVEEGLLRALQEADRFRVAHQSFELFRGETRLARFQAMGDE